VGQHIFGDHTRYLLRLSVLLFFYLTLFLSFLHTSLLSCTHTHTHTHTCLLSYSLLRHILPSLSSAEVEVSLNNSGSSYQWLENGVLKTVTKVLPAIRKDSGVRRSDTKNFFNSVVAAYTGTNRPFYVISL
jgi:hypothetical protein